MFRHLGLEVQRRDSVGKILLSQYENDFLPDPTQEELNAFLATGNFGGAGDEAEEDARLFDVEPLELVEEKLGSEHAVEGDVAQPFHAASFVASYRLMRNVESARAMCKAMEVFGEPVRELLFEDALPGSPALSLTWEPELLDAMRNR